MGSLITIKKNKVQLNFRHVVCSFILSHFSFLPSSIFLSFPYPASLVTSSPPLPLISFYPRPFFLYYLIPPLLFFPGLSFPPLVLLSVPFASIPSYLPIYYPCPFLFFTSQLSKIRELALVPSPPVT